MSMRLFGPSCGLLLASLVLGACSGTSERPSTFRLSSGSVRGAEVPSASPMVVSEASSTSESGVAAQAPAPEASGARDGPVGDSGLVLAGALSTQEPEPDERDAWKFTLSPYLWTADIRGKVGVNGVKSDVDVSFSDLLDDLDYGAMVGFHARKGDAGAWVDVVHMVLSSTEPTPVGPGDVKLRHGYVELVGFHSIDDGSPTDVFAGVRRVLVSARVELAGFRRSESAEWTDPIVGVRRRFELSDKWGLRLRGDIGGFGINDASDWSYSALARATYAITDSLGWTLGYRYLMMDYDGGTYTHDLRYQSILTGLEFHF